MCDGGGLRTLQDTELIEGDARGIAVWQGDLYVLRGSTRYKRGLWRVHSDTIKIVQMAEQNEDWHGMCATSGGLLCATSGKVYRWPLPHNRPEQVEIKGKGHMNDVAMDPDGKIIVSRFGHGVVDTNCEAIHGPYEQPHTLIYDDAGQLWHCDSTKGRVLVDGKEWLGVDGYARGIAHVEGNVFIGVSGDRHNSKRGSARIQVHDVKTGALVDTVKFEGSEIYAIAKWSNLQPA